MSRARASVPPPSSGWRRWGRQLSLFALAAGIGASLGWALAAPAHPGGVASDAAPEAPEPRPSSQVRVAVLETSLELALQRLDSLERALDSGEAAAREERVGSAPAPLTRAEPELPEQRFEREPTELRWSRDASGAIRDWFAGADAAGSLGAVDCRSSLCAIELVGEDVEADEELLERLLWDPPWNAALHTVPDPAGGVALVYLERRPEG